MKNLCVATLVLFILCAVSYSQPFRSNATYGDPNPNGACGYGQYGVTANGGRVTAVAFDTLWRNGAGCGDCYQVICTDQRYCNSQGVRVLVTNQGGGGGTDFVMSRVAFGAMARPGSENELLSTGNVGVSYRRVPCQFPGMNVLIRITDDSRFPGYLSLSFLNIGGSSDIAAVQVMGPEGGWVSLGRVYGEVFATSNAPRGPLSVRLQLSDSTTWRQATNVIPNQWRPGQIYDANFQLS